MKQEFSPVYLLIGFDNLMLRKRFLYITKEEKLFTYIDP